LHPHDQPTRLSAVQRQLAAICDRARRVIIEGIVRCKMFLSDLGTIAGGFDTRAARDEIAARAELGLIRAVFSARVFC
jgi:hypothetical protein